MYHQNSGDDHARRTTRRTAWWTLDSIGSVVGFVFAILSVTPSLLPRPAILQGVLAALAFGIGYLLGAVIWAIIRKLLWKDGAVPHFRRIWWFVYAGAWILAVVALSVLSTVWQNEVRSLVSMPPLDRADIAGFAIAFIPVAVLLLLLGKTVRLMRTRLRRRMHTVLATAATAIIVGGVAAGLVFAALATVDRIYFDRNHLPEESVEEPDSEFRSAGPESAIAWESLGRHGAEFVGGGPSAAEITEVTGVEAIEPIRVYAGLKSAPTLAERTALVVDELERTGAFDREVLVVATTTGSGWLEPQTVDAVEYLHGGDTAIAAMQYAYTPSWVSFIFDPDAPVEAARALFDAIEAKVDTLPADKRPQLISYGLSLGAHGSQAVFADITDLRERTDGALFVGSPNGSSLWRTLQAARDDGSPEWQPVLDDGREVRWISRAGDEEQLSGPWENPRVLYLQHATDPVTWLSSELLWSSPEWLDAGQRSPDISTAMRWIPIVTGLQVTVDMLVGEAVPASYGHNYGDVVLTAWQQVAPSDGIDDLALERVQAALENYSTIPRHEE
ncbi:alpha/beta hydrolase [Leucobacter aridicollis]|uniref:alpha/beta hydrolase n=1 Tax=Leucobacter aridicollis TaxID=283878 RepID=UPI0021032343|nr:alpha/beta hydrolase [Leucobacter aridicollis]UTX52090.1 alpha/beta hydrolase [Leucobacter aridicollis]